MLFVMLTVSYMHLFLFGLSLDNGFSGHGPQYSIIEDMD